MSRNVVVLLALLMSPVSLFGEGEIIHLNEHGGIETGFREFKDIRFDEAYNLRFEIYNNKPLRAKSPFYRIVKDYPVFACSLDGVAITNHHFSLQCGESVSWGYGNTGHHRWGVLSYISGKDIPIDIDCPDVYRESERVIHFVYQENGGMRNQNILFDPDRKKQFNIVIPREYEYQCFPHRPMAMRQAYTRHKRDVALCLCDIANETVKGRDFTGIKNDCVIVEAKCDYSAYEKMCWICGSTNMHFSWSVDLDALPFCKTDVDAYTNIFVTVKNCSGMWKVMGVVAQSTLYAPRCFLLDDNGRLVMSHCVKYRKYEDYDHYHLCWRDVEEKTINDVPHDVLEKYDDDGSVISGVPYEKQNAEFEAMRNDAFGWSGAFTIERLRKRAEEDARRFLK